MLRKMQVCRPDETVRGKVYELTYFVVLVPFLFLLMSCSDSGVSQSDIEELKQEIASLKKEMNDLRKSRIVKAEKLVLLDRKGNSRATLGMSENSSPQMVFYDEKGNNHIELGLSEKGSPSLIFRDGKGSSGGLYTYFLLFHSKDGTALRLDNRLVDGIAGLHLNSGESDAYFGIHLNKDGSAALTLTNKDGLSINLNAREDFSNIAIYSKSLPLAELYLTEGRSGLLLFKKGVLKEY